MKTKTNEIQKNRQIRNFGKQLYFKGNYMNVIRLSCNKLNIKGNKKKPLMKHSDLRMELFDKQR